MDKIEEMFKGYDFIVGAKLDGDTVKVRSALVKDNKLTPFDIMSMSAYIVNSNINKLVEEYIDENPDAPFTALVEIDDVLTVLFNETFKTLREKNSYI